LFASLPRAAPEYRLALGLELSGRWPEESLYCTFSPGQPAHVLFAFLPRAAPEYRLALGLELQAVGLKNRCIALFPRPAHVLFAFLPGATPEYRLALGLELSGRWPEESLYCTFSPGQPAHVLFAFLPRAAPEYRLALGLELSGRWPEESLYCTFSPACTCLVCVPTQGGAGVPACPGL
jgi:hypothetical protein